jgi:Serine carboxypeptidase
MLAAAYVLLNPTRVYTGYIDFGARHLFFTFFESRNEPSEDDFILFIPGGTTLNLGVHLHRADHELSRARVLLVGCHPHVSWALQILDKQPQRDSPAPTVLEQPGKLALCRYPYWRRLLLRR